MPEAALLVMIVAMVGILGFLLLALLLTSDNNRRQQAAEPHAVARPPPPAPQEKPPREDLPPISPSERGEALLSPAERGEALLLRLLSPSQKDEYERHGRITVPITLTGTIYQYAQIGRRMSGVTWIPGNASTKRAYEQCVYVIPHCPSLVKADDLISKLLWLRTDPASLARVSGLVINPRMFPPSWFRTTDTPI